MNSLNSANEVETFYPFGMLMPERSFSAIDEYRFGFNGKENDVEDGFQDYGMRTYNPRIGQFISVDPLFRSFPWFSSYQFSGDMPIAAIDLDGLESSIVVNKINSDGSITIMSVTNYTDINGKPVNMLLKINGVDQGNKNILVLNYDANQKYISKSQQDVFSDEQQHIIDDGLKTSVTQNEGQLAGNFPFKKSFDKTIVFNHYQLADPAAPVSTPITIRIPGVGTSSPGRPLNFNINATFNGSSSIITNVASLRLQLAPVVNYLNSNNNASLFVTGNVAGSTSQNWNSPTSAPGVNYGQLAFNRAASIVTLVKTMGLLNAKQAVNAGRGSITGGYSANGTVQTK